MSINETNLESINNVINFVVKNEFSQLYKEKSIHKISQLKELSTIPPLVYDDLITHLDKLSHYPESEVRFTSSIFPQQNLGDLILIPQLITKEWHTLSQNLELKKPAAAMQLLPTFWQLGPFFYATCRQHSIPVSLIAPRSIHLAKQVIDAVGIDFFNVTKSSARDLSQILLDDSNNINESFWHIITSFNDEVLLPDLAGDGTIEYHIFPGIPVATISLNKYQESRDYVDLTPSDDYYFECSNGSYYVTSLTKEALPLVRYEIPEICESTSDGGLVVKK